MKAPSKAARTLDLLEKSTAKMRRRKPPIGLVMLMRVLTPNWGTGDYGRITAAEHAETPARVLASLEKEQSLDKVLAAVVNEVYPGSTYGPDEAGTASTCTSHSMNAAFYAGAATAWHVITALRSREGVR